MVMSFALASTFVTAAPAQAYTSYPNSTNRAIYAARVTYDLNVIRARHGLGQLTPTDCPLSFATKLAYHLAATGTFHHQSMYTILSTCHATLTPTDCPLSFATKLAYHLAATGTFHHQSMYTILSTCHATVAAENLGHGNVGPDAMVAAWMASPAHRANILDSRLTRIGVGEFYANGQWVVATDFTRS